MRYTVMIGLGALLLLGCGAQDPGEVSILFAFEEPRPSAGTAFYASVSVQADDTDGARSVVAASPVTAYVVGEPFALQLDKVPNGSRLVVVVELRESENLAQRVRFYGLSGAFALNAGEQGDVNIAVPLARPRTEGDARIGILTRDGEQARLGTSDLNDVSISLASANAVRVELANSASLTEAQEVDFATHIPCGQTEEGETLCLVTGWDLTAGAGEPVDGQYSVFARFIDANGYGGPIESASIRADTAPPQVLRAVVAPPLARPGDTVVISVTTDEPVALPTLRVIPDGSALILEDPTQTDTTTTWHGTVRSDAMAGSTLSFEVELQDLVGNPPTPVTVALDPTLTIDASPPTVALSEEPTVNGMNDGLRFEGDLVHATAGDALEFSLEVGDDLALRGTVAVSIGATEVPCTVAETSDEIRAAYDCVLTVDGQSPASGRGTLTVVAEDAAGNRTKFKGFSVFVDRVDPDILGMPVLARSDGRVEATEVDGTLFLAPETSGMVVVTLTEAPATPPMLVLGDQTLMAVGWAIGDPIVRFSVGPFEGASERTMTAMMTVQDRAGNVLEADLAAIIYDPVAPAALTDDQLAQAVLVRAPRGAPLIGRSEFTEVQICPKVPDESLSEVCPDAATVSFDPDATLVVSRRVDALCGSSFAAGRPDVVTGALVIPLFGDFPQVCLSTVDRAGNTSQALPLPSVVWIGSLKDKVVGSSVENPLVYQTWPAFDGRLRVPSEQAERGDDSGVGDPDTAGIVTEGAGRWNQVTTKRSAAFADGSQTVFDPARGVVLDVMACKHLTLRLDGDCGSAALFFANQLLREWDGVRWTAVADPVLRPSPLELPAVAFDAEMERLVVIGGRDSNGTTSQVWTWQPNRWTRHEFPSSYRPPARSDAAVAYDSKRGRVAIFGGCGSGRCNSSPSARLGDLWFLRGDTWGEREFGGDWPEPRNGGAMAYDVARDALVLFGGDGLYSQCDGGPNRQCQTTWTFHADSWTRHDTYGAGEPTPPGGHHAMVYDSDRERVVLRVCHETSCQTLSLWEWDGVAWVETESRVPVEVAVRSSLAYDSVRGQLIVGTAETYAKDADGLSLVNAGLTNDVVDGGPPLGDEVAFAYIASTAGAFILAYSGLDLFLSEQVLQATAWSPAGWEPVDTSPGARGGAAIAPIAEGREVLLFGGYEFGPDTGEPLEYTDTWRYDVANAQWELVDGPSPTPRFGHAMATNTDSGGVLLFGGLNVQLGQGCPDGSTGPPGIPECGFDDTWRFLAGAWTKLDLQPRPSIRWDHGLAYDEQRNVFVLFGGRRLERMGGCDDGLNASVCHPKSVWEFDGTEWIEVTPTDPEADGRPSPRFDHSMAYDPARGTVILYGGHAFGAACDEEADGLCRDVWEWNGTSWHRLPSVTAATSESAPFGGDPGRGKMMVTAEGITAMAFPRPAEMTPDRTFDIHRFDTGSSLRPAHLLTVPRTALGGARDVTVQALTVEWLAGGEVASGTDGQMTGTMLHKWQSTGWEAVAEFVEGDTSEPALHRWDANPEMLSRLFVGADNAFRMALTPRAANGTATTYGKVRGDYVEVRLRYSID